MKWIKYVFLFGWLTSLYSNKDEQQNEINIQVHNNADFKSLDIIAGNSVKSCSGVLGSSDVESPDVQVSEDWNTFED